MPGLLQLVLPILLGLLTGYQTYKRRQGTQAVDLLEHAIEVGGDGETKQLVANMPPSDAKNLIEDRLSRKKIREMLRAKKKQKKT